MSNRPPALLTPRFQKCRGAGAVARRFRSSSPLALLALFACALALANCGRTDLVFSEPPGDGGLPPACRSDADCASTPATPVCDVSSGACVQCNDAGQCPAGAACQNFVCVDHCGSDAECPSGSVCCGGLCANELTDPANCGACNRPCASDQICLGGSCTGKGCGGGLTRCANACVDENNDPRNCGGCGLVCPPGQACTGAVCSGGSTSCRTTGCGRGLTCCGDTCIDTQADLKNCGGCFAACPPPATSCRAGGCCLASRGGGTCGGIVCPGGLTNCANVCVDENRDPRNCGACGLACAPGLACLGGGCVPPPPTGCRSIGCGPGLTCCGDTCIDTRSDLKNCGGCFSACQPNATSCQGGACCVVSPGGGACGGRICPGGLTNCANACVDENNDPANCGGCRFACAPGQKCSAGACVGPPPPNGCATTGCPPGLTCCGDACVDTKADLNNCGGCLARCSPDATFCQNGGCCQSTGGGIFCKGCVGNRTNCGNACVDESVDPNNCGLCGRVCAPGDICQGGTCLQVGCNGGPICAPGQACCPAGCANTSSDPLNCGKCTAACGAPPNASATCSAGACGFACARGVADCDSNPSNGCETDLSNSSANCGSCGAACGPGGRCVAGSCVANCACAAPEVCCGSDATTCTNPRSDPNHCGGCGNVCAPGTTCVAGACVGMNEGAFDPLVNPTYLTPGVHNFTTINVPPGVVVYVAGAGSPSGTLDLRATGDITIGGTIDVSGGPGVQNTITSQSTSAGRAGSGGYTAELRTAPLPIACGFDVGNGGPNGLGPAGTIGTCPAGPTTCDGAMPLLFAAPPAQFGGGAGVFTGYRAYGSGGGGPAGGAPGALGAPFFGEADCSGASGGGGATNGAGGRATGAPYDGLDGILGQTQCLGERAGAPQAFVGGGGGGSIGTGAANDLAVITTFQTGSGGGGGSADYLDRPAFGGTSGGGGAGGALRLSTPTTIAVTGQLLARGGNGGDAFIGNGRNANCDPQPGAGGGGGSGGVIYLQAPSIAVAASAVIATDGGAGGVGSEFATGGVGGDGGIGRVRLSVNPSSCTLLGAFAPPLASGCAPTAMAAPGTVFVGVYPM